MGREAVVQSHLEVLMQEWLEAEHLKVTPEDEIDVQSGTAAYSARVRTDRSEPHVEVYSVVLSDVERDPGLFEALNEINRTLGHSRIFWWRETVVLAGELVGATADVTALGCLCAEIASRADQEGPVLAKTFGGLTFDQRTEESG